MEVTNAVGLFKARLQPESSIEVDNCISEAQSRRNIRDLNRAVTLGDHLIQPAASLDDMFAGNLQSNLSGLVDGDNMTHTCSTFERQEDWQHVHRLKELGDDSVSHEWIGCLNPIHGPILPPHLFLIALKIAHSL